MTTYTVKGWHVLVGVVMFFGVTIAVNVAFVVFAVTTFPGEVASEPYIKGLRFNDTLAERAHQAEVGWTADIAIARMASGDAELVVTVRDQYGAAIRGLNIAGAIGRPASDAEDRTLEFAQAGAAYVSTLEQLGDGAWRVTAQTTLHDGAPFEAYKNVWLQ